MLFVKIGILFCALSVIIGAFGAHSLENTIADKMATFRTGVQYQIFHGLGLILIGILSKVLEIDLSMSGYFIIAGILFFSGSLFLISIFKLSFMGAIAPIGGLSFILGWITLFLKINS